jgi:ribosomal protein S18 acetylase RimI-like enzyme
MTRLEAEVRSATESDLVDIVSHYGSEGVSPLNPFSSIERIRLLPIDGFLIAEIDQTYAGFLFWFSGNEPLHDYKVSKYGYISEVKVVKEYYGKKVGLALLHEAFRRMEKAGLYIIYTHVNEDDKALLNLYEQLNFTTYSTTKHLRLTNPASGPPPVKSTIKENLELAVHMVELKEECRTLLISYDELLKLLDLIPVSDTEGKRILNSRIWSRLQVIMYSATIIARLLWPNPKPRPDGSDKRAILRARKLRNALHIQGKKSLLPIDVRNAIEHIDERLIDWVPMQSDKLLLGWALSSYDKSEEPKEIAMSFRYFNLNTQELRVGKSSCNLNVVTKFVKEIEKQIWTQADIYFEEKGDWNRKSGSEDEK